MLRKILATLMLTVLFTFLGINITTAAIPSRGSAIIYPNKLTITWADGSKAAATIDTFRFHGYNVAQLRTMVSALGGSVSQLQDGTYQINTSGSENASSHIGFSKQTEIQYELNKTSIRDVSGKLFYPQEPGWVLLTDFSYNWASVRDIIKAIGLNLDSFTDDPAKGTTTIVVSKDDSKDVSKDDSKNDSKDVSKDVSKDDSKDVSKDVSKDDTKVVNKGKLYDLLYGPVKDLMDKIDIADKAYDNFVNTAYEAADFFKPGANFTQAQEDAMYNRLKAAYDSVKGE